MMMGGANRGAKTGMMPEDGVKGQGVAVGEALESGGRGGPHWEAALEALRRAEAATVRMWVHLASVTAYPLSLLLGRGSQGNQMIVLLSESAPALIKALQV